MRRGIVALTSAALLLGIASWASAQTIHFVGSNGGEPVDGTAVLTFGNGTLSVQLTNNVDDPHAAGSLLGGIRFTLPVSNNATVASRSGTLIDIGSGGVISAPTATQLLEIGNWDVARSGSVYTLTSGGGGLSGNDPLIIGNPNGSNVYGNANPSITNGSHNPYVEKTGTFTLNIAGLTSSSLASNFSFFWGTGYDTVDGTTTITNTPPVPLPPAVWMGAGTLGAMAIASRFRRRRLV